MTSEADERDAFSVVRALKAFPELAQVHPDDLVGLASRAIERRCAAGARLAPGGEAGSVLFLLEGRGRDAERVHEAPALLGMLPALAGDAGPELVADTDAVALEVARPDLLEALEDEFELWLAALRLVCRSICEAAPCEQWHSPDPGPGDPVDLAGRIRLLRRMPPFAGLRVSLLGQLAAEMQARPVEAAGGMLWEAGDPATHALWILAGSAEADAPGGAPARRLRAGAMVGLPETLAGGNHGYGLRVREPVHALELEGEALIDALEDDAGSALELLCALARDAQRAARGAAAVPDAPAADPQRLRGGPS